VEATPSLAPRLAQACAALSAAHKQAGDQRAAEACLERLIAGAEGGGGDAGARAAAAEAAENLGVMLMGRGEEARGEAQLAAAYALRRGLLGGACTQADVARARLLLGMARAQGRREAFVKACAEGGREGAGAVEGGEEGVEKGIFGKKKLLLLLWHCPYPVL
jgi:tetratricopeptide (TPR) repeat protein